MAKQTFRKWFLSFIASFNKAGAAAVVAGPVGVVAIGGEDIWHRVVTYLGFAAATFVLAGIHGIAAFLAEDPVPFDDDVTGPEKPSGS